ncbi:MAG: FAD:protein FMN transferase [Butyrivibrio sp.]|nr:FAD:protein FMN transferase [Butyrivibrio sp.]
MDTIMEIQAAGDEELLTGAETMIRDLEKKLSVTDEESEIYALNRDGEAVVSSDVADIMTQALAVCDETDGALDISIYPVLKAWGFTTGSYRVPEADEIDALLENVDYRKVQQDTGTVLLSPPSDAEATLVTIAPGMQVDLGSVVKGYTGSAIAQYLRDNGVKSALINLGGNVECIGKKPDGNKWKVAIKSPFADSKTGIFGVIDAEDMAIITSGGYERYFEEDGKTYWHILDPKTGYPAENGLVSVTIIGSDGLRCDGLSTALFVMGLDSAIDFWKQSGDFDAVFITESGEAYITSGIADSFTLYSEYYDAPLHVLSR